MPWGLENQLRLEAPGGHGGPPLQSDCSLFSGTGGRG
jgi:hypothetical protein